MKKKLLIVAGAIVGAAALAWLAFFVYGRYLVADAPEAFTPATATATADSEPIDVDGTWTVSGGEGGYRVEEVLSGQQNTVAGRTDEVSGSLTVEDRTLIEGVITVDLASVETDDAARDTFYRGHLDVGEFPTAEFTFTSSVDVSSLAEGRAPVSTTVAGELTLHGVTREVEAEVDARRSGGDIAVVGSIELDYTEYDLSAPNLGFAVVEPDAVIEVSLVFSPGQ